MMLTGMWIALIVRSIAASATSRVSFSGKLKEMAVETEVPVWLTLTGMVPVVKRLNAENGTTVSWATLTAAPVETLAHNVLNPETPRYHRRVVGLHVKNEEVPRLVRDAGSQAGVWALALQDAITDSSVTVKPGPHAQKAARLSGHFFMSERLGVVPAIVSPRPRRPSSVKGRRIKQG